MLDARDGRGNGRRRRLNDVLERADRTVDLVVADEDHGLPAAVPPAGEEARFASDIDRFVAAQ